MMYPSLVFDQALIRRYDKSGPRYTSYPTAVQFHSGYGDAEYRAAAAASNAKTGPLSLYFHIPFCDTLCFYCGCTPTFISHDEMRALMRVTREHFALHDDDSGEYSIEIDPRETDNNTIAVLRELGFNRLSLGVQDFEESVQRAVNRLQSEAE